MAALDANPRVDDDAGGADGLGVPAVRTVDDQLSTHHNVVTLSGTVRSAADRDAAVAAAASADWVVDVEDKIRVA